MPALQLILLIGLLPAVGATLPPIGGVSRPNYGVDFNFLFQINNMHGSWRHVWTLDLNILDRGVPPSPKINCNLTIPGMCVAIDRFMSDGMQAIWNVTQIMRDAHSWAKDPQLLATINRGTSARRKRSRSKRSLLPFVGDIEKSLFGVATESDISAMQTSIQDLTAVGDRVSREITQLGSNLASLTKINDETLKNTKRGFEAVKNMIGNVTTQVNTRITELDNYLKKENYVIGQLVTSDTKTWSIMNEAFKMQSSTLQVLTADILLLQGLQQILMGYIPIALFPPPVIQKGLTVALKGIRENFPNAQLSYDVDSIGYYYTHKIVTPIIETDKISLIVDIPVDMQQQILNVYAIRTFPVNLLPYNPYTHQVDPNTHATAAQSILEVEHPYFLINQDGTQWSTGDEFDINLCRGETIRRCPKQFPLYYFKKTACLEHLWEDSEFSNILNVCSYRLAHVGNAVTQSHHVQVVPLNGGRWYIEAPLTASWTIVCPQRPPESRKPCTSCVIQVDCGCGVNSEHFVIPTRLSTCLEVFSPLKKDYTINPFNYLPKDTPWVVNLTGSEINSSPPKFSPSITIPGGDNWDDVMESMDEKHFDLNRLYQKQINETKMFRTEAEALLQKLRAQDSLLQSLAGWPDWIIGMVIVLTFVNSGILGLIIFCTLSRRVGGIPIDQERRFLEHLEGEIVSLEVIILIITSISLFLLLVISWPVLSGWIRTRKWYKKIVKAEERVKANGYRKRAGGRDLVLAGIAQFRAGEEIRSAPVHLVIVCFPPGTHVISLPEGKTVNDVDEVSGQYIIRLPGSVKLMTSDNQSRSAQEFSINKDYFHRKLGIPDNNRLDQILNYQILMM